MIARCPSCAQLFPVLGSSRSPCPFCGAALEITIERIHGEVSGPPPRKRTAWEDAAGGSRTARFGKTVQAVLRAPHRFFRGLDVEELGGSISFAAIVLLPALAVHLAAAYLLFVHSRAHAIDGRFFVFAPLLATLFVTHTATFYQAATAIASRRRPPFRGTIRGMCFGFAPMILAIIPGIGLVVGFLWSLVLHAIALRELHGLGRAQAAIVVAIPPLVVILLSIVYS